MMTRSSPGMGGRRSPRSLGWRAFRPYAYPISMPPSAGPMSSPTTSLNAAWDREVLAIGLQALVDLDFDVEMTGFSLAEIDLVLDEARESSQIPNLMLTMRSLPSLAGEMSREAF